MQIVYNGLWAFARESIAKERGKIMKKLLKPGAASVL